MDLWQGFEPDFLQVLDLESNVLQQCESKYFELNSSRDQEFEHCEFDSPLDLFLQMKQIETKKGEKEKFKQTKTQG